ncbi:MAG: hypothetical protein JO209_05025 [Acidisphaera sp.]|nr:hypothetical protein [Acidisphaera sp.]
MRPEPTAPIVTFYRLIEQARLPQRADRSAAGTLPTRATRYCDAVTSASAFGWWVFPPMEFSLLWDGEDVFWSFDERWLPLSAAQFPHQSARFDEAAPASLKGCSPPFLTALPEPGAVQIWTGMFARTAPEWSLLIRPLANLPASGGFALYEGIVETDRWFGPLFTNLRLTRTASPVRFRADFPLAQVQPLPRAVYAEETLGASAAVADLEGFAAQDWDDYYRSVVQPNDDPQRSPGLYAVAARRRRKAGQGRCPWNPLGPSAPDPIT